MARKIKIPKIGKAIQSTEDINKGNEVVHSKVPQIDIKQPSSNKSKKSSIKNPPIAKDKTIGSKKNKPTRNKKPKLSPEQRKILREISKSKTKERTRIKAFIKRAEKRGYNFDPNLINELSQMSLNELVALQPEVLYELSTSEKFGYLMSGTEARKRERQLSALKAQQTREEKKRKYTGDAYIPEFTDIVLKNVEAMIEEAKNASWSQFKRNGFTVERDLSAEIMTYGRDKVALACEEAPDEVIGMARMALQASTDDSCKNRSTEMIMIITSHIPTIDEQKKYDEDEEDFMPLADDMDEDFPF